MKVRIALTLDIDPEAWTLNYGIQGAQEIREDAKVHATHTLTETFRDLGLLIEEGTP